MKFLFPTALVITLFSACTNTVEEKKALLPESSGSLAEIVVLSDKATLDSAFRLEVESVFSRSLDGQPSTDEKVFDILFADEDYFSGYFEKHQNIFILLSFGNAEKLKKVLPAQFVDGLVETLVSKHGILGVKQVTVFAQNQNIFIILGENKASLLDKLRSKKDDLLKIAKDQENITGKEKLLGNVRAKDDFFYQKSLKDRGFGVRVPKTYRVAIDLDDFVWIRKEITNEEKEMSIILFEAPYTSVRDLNTKNLLAIRNDFTKRYIPGVLDGSYMKYSSGIDPVRSDQNFKDKYGVEIRGWWDVQGDFMGGPSYIRAVVDEANSRIVFAEGFLFYPNEKKAKSMRELEILVNTLSIK